MDSFLFIFTVCFFGLIVLLIGKAIYNSISEKLYNDSQPVLTKDAKIVGKRTEISGGGKTSVSTHYYTTFEFIEDKNRLELEIDSDEYGLLAENDIGKLTFQGRRFLKFQRTFKP